VDKLTLTSAAPLVMDPKTKKYPIPQPGIIRDREYLVAERVPSDAETKPTGLSSLVAPSSVVHTTPPHP